MKKQIYEVDLSLDTKQLYSEIKSISEQIAQLKEDMRSLSKFFSTCISYAVIDVGRFAKSLKDLGKVGEEAKSAFDLSSLETAFDNLLTALEDIRKELESSNWVEAGATVMDGLTFMQTAFEHSRKYKPSKQSSPPISNTPSKTSGASGGIITAESSQQNLESLKNIFGSLFSGLTEFSQMPDFGSLIPESVKNIFSTDLIKIPQVSSEATTALNDLATKLTSVASATELQNAATTAWNGVSSIASSTTTAFGSAMDIASLKAQLITLVIAAIIAIIAYLIANWDEVCAKAKEVWTAIQEKLSAFGEFMKNIFAKDFTEQFGVLGISLNVFFDQVEGVWNAIKKVFGGIVDFVKNVFAGNWSAAWDSIVQIFTGIWEGIVGYFKPPLNAIIGFINGLISAIVNAVNFVIRAVNKLSIDIPNWDIFGSLAGKTFGLNIPLVSGCEIPYLAQGAVLPANRPFMAIVGDQRHGTNVEAPLATIQEAVAVVMEDQTAAIVAGFNASIGIQRELLSAVLGIRIGDEVIGRAADRYFAKRAAMGGY